MSRTSFVSGLAAVMASASLLLAPVEASAGGSVSFRFEPKGDAAKVAAKTEKFLNLVEAAKRNSSGKGSGNTAAATQNGTGNNATIYQRGRGHAASLTQNGDNNRYGIFQFGRNTTANVTQTGNGRTGYLIQGGW